MKPVRLCEESPFQVSIVPQVIREVRMRAWEKIRLPITDFVWDVGFQVREQIWETQVWSR